MTTFYFLEHHFGSLLNSEAANRIIERKINLALVRPEGKAENYHCLHNDCIDSMYIVYYVLHGYPTPVRIHDRMVI